MVGPLGVCGLWRARLLSVLRACALAAASRGRFLGALISICVGRPIMALVAVRSTPASSFASWVSDFSRSTADYSVTPAHSVVLLGAAVVLTMACRSGSHSGADGHLWGSVGAVLLVIPILLNPLLLFPERHFA